MSEWGHLHRHSCIELSKNKVLGQSQSYIEFVQLTTDLETIQYGGVSDINDWVIRASGNL